MTTVRPFHRYRGESTFTMSRLLTLLKEQLPLVAPAQTKYRVTDIPTERTVRFYTSFGLVDKPSGRDGARALYGYRHLLQIMAVKFLQSQYLPLVKIRSVVHNAGNRDLELLIPERVNAAATTRNITRGDRPAVDNTPGPAVERTSFQQAGQSGDPGENFTAEATSDDTWHRIEVGPGIELHVHAAVLTVENRERLRGALLRELGVLRGWFGEGKH